MDVRVGLIPQCICRSRPAKALRQRRKPQHPKSKPTSSSKVQSQAPQHAIPFLRYRVLVQNRRHFLYAFVANPLHAPPWCRACTYFERRPNHQSNCASVDNQKQHVSAQDFTSRAQRALMGKIRRCKVTNTIPRKRDGDFPLRSDSLPFPTLFFLDRP